MSTYKSYPGQSVTTGNRFPPAYARGLKPDPLLTVDSWSDRYRVLSQRASAEPGKWRTSRVPYLREIMACLSPSSRVEKVVFMKAAQTGGTEVGLNWLGYIIHHAPAPVMIVWPTIDMARRNSRQRITPMIEETSVLTDLVAPPRERDTTNTVLSKDFTGGVMVMTGANSATGLRSMPVRFLFLDEVDGYPVEVGAEGDAIALAEARTATFTRRKIFMVSTPTTQETSKILQAYNESDQRTYWVPCPACHASQALAFKQLKWKEDNFKSVWYECVHCKHHIGESSKAAMLAAGVWKKARPDNPIAGFHLNGLYSPWLKWSAIAARMKEAKAAINKGDNTKLKTFVNTVLAEPWKEDHDHMKAGALQAKAEDYPLRLPPEGVVVLTMGVDVQGDRLEYQTLGWGEGLECWVSDWAAIYGDPAMPDVWGRMYEVIATDLHKRTGNVLPIAAAAVDSGGHHTHEVYQFARVYSRRHVIAVHGSSIRGSAALGRPSKVDLNFKGEHIKKGARVWPVGTEKIKEMIHTRLKLEKPGPGYIHFSTDLDLDFYKQLTSEYVRHKYKRGVRISEWIKRAGRRNEGLDCMVYAFSAAIYLGIHRWHSADWERARTRGGAIKQKSRRRIKTRGRRY